MGSIGTRGRILRASLCEIEIGLFHISYYADGQRCHVPDLPPYEVGACASVAEERIERRARACGFDVIVWEHEAELTGGMPISPVVATHGALGAAPPAAE